MPNNIDSYGDTTIGKKLPIVLWLPGATNA